MVLLGAFVQVGVGLLIGTPATLVAGHLMARHFYGVTACNPLVIGVTMAALGRDGGAGSACRRR
jgi:hypothetical protein